MKKVIILFAVLLIIYGCKAQANSKNHVNSSNESAEVKLKENVISYIEKEVAKTDFSKTGDDWNQEQINSIMYYNTYQGKSVISGVLRDQFDKAIPQVNLELETTDGSYHYAMGNSITAEDGTFKFESLTDNTYMLKVSGKYIKDFETENIVIKNDNKAQLELYAEKYTDDPNIKNTLQGLVKLKDGKLADEFEIEVRNVYDDKEYSAKTNKKGVYSFDDIEMGKYCLSFEHPANSRDYRIDIEVKSDIVTKHDINLDNLDNRYYEYVVETLSKTCSMISSSITPMSTSSVMSIGNNAIAGGAIEMYSSAENIGLSVGGAKDIDNFRQNIKNNYMPQSTDLTYEGLFYDYYFDTDIEEEAEQLFEPSYSSSTSINPLTKEKEYYLSLGLNSNIKESDFERKNLNLTVVMDISGSMTSSFNNYYYDNRRNSHYSYNEEDKKYENMSKMEIACKVLAKMTEHLGPKDRLAIVLYNNGSALAKPLNLVGKTDMKAIRQHILALEADGGTNMYAGMQTATNLYKDLIKADKSKYENRIIFLTDAMPNRNITDEHTIWGYLKANASQGLYTSFIGVGVDFNTELVEYITKTKGANYYSVHSYRDFNKRLNEEFDFMVTPLVFDLSLEFESDSFEIEQVIGSPEANKSTGSIMYVNTLFPSQNEGGKSKGGLVLLKLKKKNGDSEKIKLKCNYKNRDGKSFTNNKKINTFSNKKGNPQGIRKGVLLARYATMLQAWIKGEKTLDANNETEENKVDDWSYGHKKTKHPGSKWERRSRRLLVEDYYKDKFKSFKQHLISENDVINDKDLQQEIELLDLLIKKN